MRCLVPAAIVVAIAGCGSTAPAPSAPSSSAPPGAPATGASGASGAWSPRDLVGTKAPAFSLDSILEPKAKVALVPGRVNLVFFWATWNEPVKKSFPRLQEVYLRYRPAGLAIAGVSVNEDAADLERFAKDLGTTFPIAWDQGHDVAARWRPSWMPTFFLVDRKGVIRRVFGGWHGDDEVEVAKEIEALLNTKE